MTPISQAAASPEFAAHDARVPEETAHAAHQIHAPSPGTTATLITDLRELFKVRVTGMVVITGWAGFYLGSMQSGISSVQRGLLDTLIGIGLVSAGASALNQALERTSDAKMKRTADRPIAAGRISFVRESFAGIGALALGACGSCCTPTCSRCPRAATAFCYVAIYTPLKRVTSLATFIGAFPGAMGPCSAGPPLADALNGLPSRCLHPLRLAVSSFHGYRVALSPRLRTCWHPHAPRRSTRRLVHGC